LVVGPIGCALLILLTLLLADLPPLLSLLVTLSPVPFTFLLVMLPLLNPLRLPLFL
jgi:hypothetical protein